MRYAAAITVTAIAITLALFFVWSIGRAFDYESRCAQVSGLCETP